MTKDELRGAIEAALEERKTKIVNRNALRALFGAFGDQVDALGQLFLGRSDAIDAERHKLEQQAILGLVCRIDEALSETVATLRRDSPSSVLVQGFIDTVAINAGAVTGVNISTRSGPVEFKSGTHIRTIGNNVDKLTGLRIAGDKSEDR
jgi:hypothetical protein